MILRRLFNVYKSTFGSYVRHYKTMKELSAYAREKGPPWNVAFMGNDDFALESLITLQDQMKQTLVFYA